MRNHPIAAAQHLARNLGISPFIGVEQRPLREEGEPQHGAEKRRFAEHPRLAEHDHWATDKLNLNANSLLLYRGVTDQTQTSWIPSAGFALALPSSINF